MDLPNVSAYPIYARPEQKKKQRKGEFVCSPWAGISTFHSLVLEPSDSHLTAPLAFLVVQIADNRSWDFSAFIMTWANVYDKSPHLYILLVLFLWTNVFPDNMELLCP